MGCADDGGGTGGKRVREVVERYELVDRLGAAFRLQQQIFIVEVVQEPGKDGVLFEHLELLIGISDGLLIHNCLRALESGARRSVKPLKRDSGTQEETCSTAGLPHFVLAVVLEFHAVGLDARRKVVQHRQVREIITAHLLEHLLIEAVDALVTETDANASGDIRPKNGHVRLVVDEFALVFALRLVLELSPADGVTRCPARLQHEEDAAAPDEHHARLEHNLVHHAHVDLHLDVSFFVHLSKARKQVSARDPYLVEAGKAVISTVETEFLADVSELDAGHHRVVVEVPDL